MTGANSSVSSGFGVVVLVGARLRVAGGALLQDLFLGLVDLLGIGKEDLKVVLVAVDDAIHCLAEGVVGDCISS